MPYLFSAAEVDEFAHAAVKSAKAGDLKAPSELVNDILALHEDRLCFSQVMKEHGTQHTDQWWR